MNMKTNILFRFCLLAFLSAILLTCEKDNLVPEAKLVLASDFSSDVPLDWHKLFEEIDRYAPGYRPPAAARALGYLGLAGYEAAVPGMPGYQSLGDHFAGLRLPEVLPGLEYHWPSAVNAAYYQMFKKLYPHVRAADLEKIENLNQRFEQEFLTQTAVPVFLRSKRFGDAVAEAVFDWSATDAIGHEAYLNPRPSDYTPPQGPGLWQPTWPNFTPALLPYWGQARTFAMEKSELLSRPPLPWSEDPNSQFYAQAKEVKIWVDRVQAGQDLEGYWIAEFWSDDHFEVTFTPAGRWVAIANQVVEIERPSLETAVELYAKMGMSLCDAGIAVWHSKYAYNYERPIDYIRRTFDPNWTTVMNNPLNGYKGLSPQFPAYPSGHSGFGGAGATILTDIFGFHYVLTDRCHENRTEFRGTPRTFRTFIDMAVENAFSRIPLGVHYRMDCEEGLRQGYLAGQRVLELPWKR